VHNILKNKHVFTAINEIDAIVKLCTWTFWKWK